jgi:hypothetical protein
MKNTLLILSKKIFFFCLSMLLTTLLSCSNEEESAPAVSSDEKETASFEAQDDYYFSDADDLATAAFIKEDNANAGGKTSTDVSLIGAIVLHSGTVSNGSLSIDFGSGCTDLRGNVRKGTITVTHVGAWNEEGAQWTITFSGYSINGITLEGTRKVTVINVTEFSVTHDVELLDGSISWPDGISATRTCHYIRERKHDENHILDRLIVYGEAQGTLRNGRGYSIEITEELIYDRSCIESGVFIAVQGKKIIKHGERELTVDYGDGTCDNMVTLTNKAGFSVRFEVSK